MLPGDAVAGAHPCEQSVSCHGWQSLVVNVVSGHGNGTPSTSSTYNYGSR